MLSDRRSERGFTLLESLLAVAMVALFAIPVLNAFSRAAVLDQGRIAGFELHEFAVSLLEESVGAGDFEARSGNYGDRFDFSVEVREVATEQASRFDDLIDHIEVTVVASYTGQPETGVTLLQIVAVGAPE